MTSQITTHILDTSLGRPASGVTVMLERQTAKGEWTQLGAGETDADGRNKSLMTDQSLTEGLYRISFETGPYFDSQSVDGFYPSVSIVFKVVDPNEHYHVPLLLNPYGFSTYRGS
tara:strand:- start:249 stop:593 length:345 start_codon:yes stop_codon:yes gene_type:complete